jgi:hypothetical protein
MLVTVNVVPSSPTLATLIIEALQFSETLVLTRIARRTILESGILQMYVIFITELCRLTIVLYQKCSYFSVSGFNNFLHFMQYYFGRIEVKPRGEKQ